MGPITKTVIGVLTVCLFIYAILGFGTNLIINSNTGAESGALMDIKNVASTTAMNISTLNQEMTTALNTGGGISVTTAGFLLLTSAYNVAMIPFGLMLMIPNLISIFAGYFDIDAIYIYMITVIMGLVFITAIIALLFGKEY